MIATVIQGKTYAEILSLLDDPWVELAEIRLDLCPLSDSEIEDLFANTDTPLIATCRADWGAEITSSGEIAGVRNQNQPKMLHPPVKNEWGASKSAKNASALSTTSSSVVNSTLSTSGISPAALSPAEAERRLTIAIQAGARFADLEIEAEAGWSKRFRDLCHEYGVEIIRSWHDFSGTPSANYLRQIQARCYRYGADIAKIVTTANSPADCEAVLSLYDASPLSTEVSPQKTPKMQATPGSEWGLPAKSAENAGNPSESAQRSTFEPQPRRLVAFAMGPAGRETRLECLRLGAPFSYASCEVATASAPGTPAAAAQPATSAGQHAASFGQYSFEEMHRLVYGDFRGFWRVGGDLAVPCSKSFAQRAIVCAALAEGRSRLRSYTPCADSEAALAVARAFGATVRKDAPGASDPAGSATLVIDGIGIDPAGGRRPKWPKTLLPPENTVGGASKSPENDAAPVENSRVATAVHPAAPTTLPVGESGLLARLCIPLMAAVSDRPVTITGEKTLLHRPLKGVQNVMASFGVPIRSELVPITVAPPLIPGNADVSGEDGSQIISGLLTALPLCAKNSTLYISEPKSIPYMFITEDILRKFGVRVKSEMEGDERMIEDQDWSGCTQVSFSIKGGQRYKAADLTLEGDWSAAANFLVAGAIFGKAEITGLNTDSLQADLAIADILVQAGAIVSELDESVCVSKAPLEAFEADLANAPDLFPVCSVLAAFCDGQTVLHGVDRLHGKESDRAAAILEMLTAFGVPADIDGNDLYINGETLASRLLNGRLLHGSGPATPARIFPTHGDHRIAMALKIASMGADSPVVLDDPDCVAKSFPEFWEQFDY